MKIMKRILCGAGLIFAMCLLILRPDLSSAAVKRGLHICVTSVLPCLFPFFVFSNLWTELGYGALIGRAVSSFYSKIFHLPPESASIFILGITGGYPVGAQSVVRSYEARRLSKEESEHLLCFCNNAGPAFILGVFGNGLFHSAAIGLLLWMIHVCSAMIIGIILRDPRNSVSNFSASTVSETTLFDALVPAIRSAGTTALQICTFILFFSFAATYLQAFLPNTTWAILFVSSVELASAALLLPHAGLSDPHLFVAAAGLLGWGGICVHYQSLSIIRQTNLSARFYLLGKVLHSAISTAFACILVSIFSSQLFSCSTAAINILLHMIFGISAAILIFFVKSSTGKRSANQV